MMVSNNFFHEIFLLLIYFCSIFFFNSCSIASISPALGVLGADGLFNPSFSFYGFSFQFLPSQGFIFTGFDPTTLAIQIGVMILQDLLSCEQQEQILAMRRLLP